MKLSVSNFAWPQQEALWCYEQLACRDIQGIEITPTKIFGSDWEITSEKVQQLKETLSQFDLTISSLQGITFGKDDIALIGQQSNNLQEHLKRVADITVILEADVAVFGAGRLRNVQCMIAKNCSPFFRT
ncbi:hypothetical protein RCJ22_14255 [Vibrio sp. FNV 38]|nr:hypothetical protein [Vibrio sp. FNV 38]